MLCHQSYTGRLSSARLRKPGPTAVRGAERGSPVQFVTAICISACLPPRSQRPGCVRISSVSRLLLRNTPPPILKVEKINLLHRKIQTFL